MTENRYKEFNKPTDAEWLEKIKKDLKGKSAEEISRSKNIEGIDLKVFYSESDSPEPIRMRAGGTWSIRQSFKNITKANQFLSGEFSEGIDEASIALENEGWPENKLNTDIKWNIDLSFFDESVVAALIKESNVRSVCFDPIGSLLEKGSWIESEKSDLDSFVRHIEVSRKENVKSLVIDSTIVGRSGGSAIQELAGCIAHLNEYLNVLKTNKIDLTGISDLIEIRMSIGTDYFLEIAKFRALRILTSNVLKAYGVDGTIAVSGKSNSMAFSSLDVNTNILRSTTMCMSAVIGGCDAVDIQNHTILGSIDGDFGNRIAKNLQIILRDESHLDKVSDPAAGSYYIDSLTKELAEKSWKHFQEIEGKGGFLSVFKSGELQNGIKETTEKRRSSVKDKSEVLIGVNEYTLEGEIRTDKLNTQSAGEFEPLTPIFLEDNI